MPMALTMLALMSITLKLFFAQVLSDKTLLMIAALTFKCRAVARNEVPTACVNS